MKCTLCEAPHPTLYTIDILDLDDVETIDVCRSCLLNCPFPILHPTTGRILGQEEIQHEVRPSS